MQIKNSRQLINEIEKARKASGLSDRELSMRCELSNATLSQIRKRGGNMNTETLLRLARELQIKVMVER